MECFVYFSPSRNHVTTVMRSLPEPHAQCLLLGTMQFTKMTEPSHQDILDWALARLNLLAIPYDKNLLITNYASHAYWGNPPYE